MCGLASIEGQTQKRIDRRWAREVEARIDAYDAGRMKSIPAAEVLQYRGKPAT
jgi:hypothetical protein